MKSFNKWLNEKAGVRKEFIDEYPNNMIDAMTDMYNNMRRPQTPYVLDITINEANDFVNTFGKENGDVISAKQAGWLFRLNKKNVYARDRKTIEQRFSLNVNPNANLIKGLDAFMQKYSDNVDSYKGALDINNWTNRHDTITMYCYDVNEKMENDLVKLASPYIRKGAENEPVVGSSLAVGITKDYEPFKERVDALRIKADMVAPELFDGVFRASIREEDGVLSAGQYAIINKLVDDFAKDKKQIFPESIEDYKKWERGQLKYEVYKEKIDGYKAREQKSGISLSTMASLSQRGR